MCIDPTAVPRPTALWAVNVIMIHKSDPLICGQTLHIIYSYKIQIVVVVVGGGGGWDINLCPPSITDLVYHKTAVQPLCWSPKQSP